jgi:hypothetical protein
VPGAERTLRAQGVRLPDHHRLVSLAEEPGLWGPMGDFNVAGWPPFMTEGGEATTREHWSRLLEQWPAFQHCLFDPTGRLVAAANSAPLVWDGTDAGLPGGWDEQLVRSAADQDAGRPPNTLGAIQIVVDPELRGSRLSGTMVQVLQASARVRGFQALVACVRPTLKSRYPLIPIERYATWTREDGLPFDPWIRLHVRLGGRIVRASPRSMTYRASVPDWEKWTGRSMPESGRYVIEGGTSPLELDRDADEGVYYDENVWMVHQV